MKFGWFGAIGLLGGCTPNPIGCSTPGTCPDGLECLANRCMPLGGEPVPTQTERLVLRAERIAWLLDDQERGAALPPAVALGAANGTKSGLLLGFAPLPSGARRLDSAFLLLTATTGGSTPVELSVWRPLGSWSDEEVSWARHPPLSGPWLSVAVLPRARDLVRLDVTNVVRREISGKTAQIRLAVLAAQTRGLGAAFATGTGAELGPTLEIYLR